MGGGWLKLMMMIITRTFNNNIKPSTPGDTAVQMTNASGATHHREDVKANLAADAVLETEGRKALLQRLHHLLPDAMHLVVPFKLVSLLLAAVATDGRNVDHPSSELDERAPLHWDVQLRQVTQHEVDELLQLGFAQEVLETLQQPDPMRAVVRAGAQPHAGRQRDSSLPHASLATRPLTV